MLLSLSYQLLQALSSLVLRAKPLAVTLFVAEAKGLGQALAS